MDFLYVKALHIIFVVTWFAGLFYIIRLFMYHVEAEKKPEPAKEILQTQYKLMSKRLWYIITWPSAILASIFGFWLIYKSPYFLSQSWMLVKLAFILALFFYHGLCHVIYKQLQNNIIKYSAFKLRMINEIPTVILFAVIFLVELQHSINWIWGVVGIILFGILLMLGIKLYKKIREKKSWEKAEKEVLESDENNQLEN